MGKFYPNTIYTVLRMNGKFGHYYTIAFIEHVIAVFHRQTSQTYGVVPNFKVGIPGVVAFIQISQRIAGLGTQSFILKIRARIMAGRKHK